MFFKVFFTSVFILQNVLSAYLSSEHIKVGDVPNQDQAEPDNINIVQDRTATQFPKGIVPYYIDSLSYDSIITARIQAAMDLIEASSCVVFKKMTFKPADLSNSSWVHFTNPDEIRECVHETSKGTAGEIVIVIGYECMLFRYILHAVLHSIGFKDEVAHPHRDQYIRIMWENIQPSYRKLFIIQHEDAPYKLVEYDPMSIMHFHDRAFSMNGAPSIAPRVPGLLIAPSEKLSQLDVMKLRLWFGHECNKRKVGALLEKCKTVFHNSPSMLALNRDSNENLNPSVEADGDLYDTTNQPEVDDYVIPGVAGARPPVYDEPADVVKSNDGEGSVNDNGKDDEVYADAAETVEDEVVDKIDGNRIDVQGDYSNEGNVESDVAYANEEDEGNVTEFEAGNDGRRLKNKLKRN